MEGARQVGCPWGRVWKVRAQSDKSTRLRRRPKEQRTKSEKQAQHGDRRGGAPRSNLPRLPSTELAPRSSPLWWTYKAAPDRWRDKNSTPTYENYRPLSALSALSLRVRHTTRNSTFPAKWQKWSVVSAYFRTNQWESGRSPAANQNAYDVTAPVAVRIRTFARWLLPLFPFRGSCYCVRGGGEKAKQSR